MQSWRQPDEVISWTVDTHRARLFEPTLMVSAPPGTKLHLEGPERTESTARQIHRSVSDTGGTALDYPRP